MNPLNNVVAHVHRVDAFGHNLHTEGILITNCFERLLPPAGPLKQRRAHRFRSAAIHVVNNRCYRFTHARTRILLLQTMTRNKALGYWLFDGHCKIHVVDAEVTGAWIEDTRFEASRRQRNKGMMLTNRNRLRHWHNLPNVLSWLFTGES